MSVETPEALRAVTHPFRTLSHRVDHASDNLFKNNGPFHVIIEGTWVEFHPGDYQKNRRTALQLPELETVVICEGTRIHRHKLKIDESGEFSAGEIIDMFAVGYDTLPENFVVVGEFDR